MSSYDYLSPVNVRSNFTVTGVADIGGPGVAGSRGAELRTFRTAWANRGTAPCNIVCVGDSVTVGYYATSAENRWFEVLKARLCQENGQNVSHGYVPISSTSHGGYTSRIWTTVAGTVTDRNDAGLGYNNSTIGVGGIQSYTAFCDRIWYFYSQFVTFAGTFNISIDGTVVASINPNGGVSQETGGRKFDSGALALGNHTLTITQTGAFSAIGEGGMFFNGNGGTSGTNGTGIRVYLSAHFGKTASTFANPSLSGAWWTDGFDNIVPHLVLVFLGINDQRSGRTPSQYNADLQTIVTRCNTVAAANSQHSPSVCFVLPYQIGTSAGLTPPYTAAAKAAAASSGAAWCDMAQLMGFVGTQSADDPPGGYGFMSALDPTNDKVHPIDKGHRLIGESVAGFLLDAVGPGDRVATSSLRVTSYDGTGVLTLPTQINGTVGVPAANNESFYGLKKAGRDLPYRRPPDSRAVSLAASLIGSRPFILLPSTGANLVSPFGSNTNLGTITHPAMTDAQGWVANFATAASANATAGSQSTNPQYVLGTTAGLNSGFFYMLRGVWVDASYANTGASTGTRMIYGLTDQLFSTVLGSDDPAGNRACFQYCNVNGGKTQTTFNVSVKDNTTETLADTGVTLTQNKLYELSLWCAPGATSIGWQVDNVTDGTTATGTVGTHLPTSSAAMRAVCGLQTIDAVARNWRMSFMFCETP